MTHAMRRPTWHAALALPVAIGLASSLASAQPAQTPPPVKHPHGQSAQKGSASLTARLIDTEKHMQHGAAYVDVQVSGVQLIDPATVNEKPEDGQGHLHYQIDDGPVIATTASKLGFHELKPGPHKLTVMLAANDHSPLGPAETIAINSDFKAGGGEHGKGTSYGDKDKEKGKDKGKDTEEAVAKAKEKGSLTVKLVSPEIKAPKKEATVEVTVTGVTLTDPVGTQHGENDEAAHLHYRVDDGPVIATSMKKLSFHELRSGTHKIKVCLAGSNHKPLGAEQTVEVTIP